MRTALRRKQSSITSSDEIRIRGDDCEGLVAGKLPDLLINRLCQTDITNVSDVGKQLRQSIYQTRRQILVKQ